jgi:hypothetical protein
MYHETPFGYFRNGWLEKDEMIGVTPVHARKSTSTIGRVSDSGQLSPKIASLKDQKCHGP